jgi:hypothetical protein
MGMGDGDRASEPLCRHTGSQIRAIACWIKDSRSAIHGEEAAQQLLRRLEHIADEAEALLKEIGVLVERFVTERGLSKQDIDRVTQQLLQQWHTPDAI